MFIGPYEHHSNELPWRESIADVIEIPEDDDGRIDLSALERALQEHADRPVKIGSFSAASNVTGILSDTRAISVMLHRSGALSFWDFAAAAPYVEVEMAPHRAGDDADLDYKDAIFLSPHKFIGGPGTPGVLVARRDLFHNTVPSVPGGGTVEYVNPLEHVYLRDIEHREEGGTPDIVGSIRAGLVFRLKDAAGAEAIREREESFTHRALHRWEEQPLDPGARQSRPPTALDRVVRHAAPGPLSASQLRGGPPERSVRDPGARGLLVRRPVRTSVARYRHHHLPRLPGTDRPRMRRHQARLGPRELHVFPVRAGVRLRPGCGGSRSE